MSYATERDAIGRTSQVILEMYVTSCDNHYASGSVTQQIDSTEDFQIAEWTKSGGTTVTADQYANPEGSVSLIGTGTNVDKIDFAAIGDYIESTDSDDNAVSTTFRAAVWLRAHSGTGTITLKVLNTAATLEETVLVCDLTETPRRFDVTGVFTGAAGGKARLRIYRDTADLASVGAWGAQLTNGTPLYSYLSQTGVGPGPNVSHCQAADAGDGSRCYYSRPTCQDPTNFKLNQQGPYPGLKRFRFCLQSAPHPLPGEDVWPMLREVEFVPQVVDPEKAITTSERVRAVFEDCPATWNWNQDKAGDGALTNTGVPSGSFWPRFMAIYRNYSNPRNHVIVKVGFVEAGGTVSEYQTRGKYLIDNMEIDNRGVVTMDLISALRLLRTKAPAKISDGNLLNGAINNSVTSAIFDDLSQLTPVGSGYTVTIQVADDDTFTTGAEFMNVTGASGNTATVQRGRWGSTAVAHADDSLWREVLMFGTERDTPSDPPIGINPIDATVALLRRAGVPAAYIDSAGLNSERDTWLAGTANPTTGTESGILFRRAGATIDAGNGGIATQADIQKLLAQVRASCMLSMGVDETGMVTGRIFAPATPATTLMDLTEERNILKDSLSVDDNEESRATRVIIARDLRADAAPDSTSIEDYQTFTVAAGADVEHVSFYGVEPRTKIVYSPWIKTGDNVTAARLARRLLRRFSNPARKIAFSLEVRDDALAPMDFAFLTTARIQKPDGTTDGQRIIEVVRKKRLGPGKSSYETIDAAAMFGRYGFIAPAGTPDYDSASAQQRRYAFIGTAADNLVGTPAVGGYIIWG